MRNLADSLDDECVCLPCTYPLRDLRGLGPCLELVREGITWLEFDEERVGIVVQGEVCGEIIGPSVDVEFRCMEDELDFLVRSSSAGRAGRNVRVGV